jgi:hypothetical protein
MNNALLIDELEMTHLDSTQRWPVTGRGQCESTQPLRAWAFVEKNNHSNVY